MLKLSANLKNLNVISLRAGGTVALATGPIINPHNLKIVGWWCKVPSDSKPKVLLASDVREVMPSGMAINDEEDISEAQDLVRFKEILHIDFEPIGKQVKTKRSKLGKVSDYSYNDGMYIQKLYVERPLTKVLAAEDTLIIDRTQIVEVTDHYILVKDTDLRAGDTELAGAAIPAA